MSLYAEVEFAQSDLEIMNLYGYQPLVSTNMVRNIRTSPGLPGP